jgi:hypothetical protein
LSRLKGHLKYTDVRLDFVQHLTSLLRERSKGTKKTATEAVPLEEGWMKNILRVIGSIASADNFGLDLFADPDDPSGANSVEDNYLEFKRRFSELWTEVMKWKMTPSVYKQVVILLPDRIMTHLNKPLLMSHFLMESFKIGEWGVGVGA